MTFRCNVIVIVIDYISNAHEYMKPLHMPNEYVYIWIDVVMIVIVITLQCNHNRN